MGAASNIMMSKPFRQAVLALGVITTASALIGAAASLANQAGGAWRPAWFMFGFELVVILAGLLAVLIARGRFGSPPLGLVCAAGCVLVATLFGYLGAGRILLGMSLTPLLGFRAVLAAAMVVVAAVVRLGRRSESIRLFRTGVAIGLILVICVGAAYALRSRIYAMSDSVLVVGSMIGFVVLTGLIAASADFLIRAFAAPADQNA